MCCQTGFVSGSGGSFPTLAANKVVVTDSSGTVTVGPDWYSDSAFNYVLFTSPAHVAPNNSGTYIQFDHPEDVYHGSYSMGYFYDWLIPGAVFGIFDTAGYSETNVIMARYSNGLSFLRYMPGGYLGVYFHANNQFVVENTTGPCNFIISHRRGTGRTNFISFRDDYGINWYIQDDPLAGTLVLETGAGQILFTGTHITGGVSTRQFSFLDAVPSNAYPWYVAISTTGAIAAAMRWEVTGTAPALFQFVSATDATMSVFAAAGGCGLHLAAMGGGDVVQSFIGSETYSFGIDSADNNNFKIGRSASLGGNPYITLSNLLLIPQITLGIATPNYLYSFNYQVDASSLGTREIRFDVTGGGDGVFHFLTTGAIGSATMQVEIDTVLNSVLFQWINPTYTVSAGLTENVWTSGAVSNFGIWGSATPGQNALLLYEPANNLLGLGGFGIAGSGGSPTAPEIHYLYLTAYYDAGQSIVECWNPATSAGSQIILDIRAQDYTAIRFQGGPVIECAVAGQIGINAVGGGTVVIGPNVQIQAAKLYFASSYVTTPPADPAGNGEWEFYALENGGAYSFEIRLRDSGGTVRSGQVVLT